MNRFPRCPDLTPGGPVLAQATLALLAWQRHVKANLRIDLDITGKLDFRTSRAVAEIQRRAGIPPSGILDTETWEATYTLSPE